MKSIMVKSIKLCSWIGCSLWDYCSRPENQTVEEVTQLPLRWSCAVLGSAVKPGVSTVSPAPFLRVPSSGRKQRRWGSRRWQSPEVPISVTWLLYLKERLRNLCVTSLVFEAQVCLSPQRQCSYFSEALIGHL